MNPSVLHGAIVGETCLALQFHEKVSEFQFRPQYPGLIQRIDSWKLTFLLRGPHFESTLTAHNYELKAVFVAHLHVR